MKASKKLLAFAGALFFLLLILCLTLPYIQYSWLFPRHAKQSLDFDVTDVNPEFAKKFDGSIIFFEDGGWIAIVCRDYHRDIIPNWKSLSFARASDGTTLRSEKHYCASIPARLNMIEISLEALDKNREVLGNEYENQLEILREDEAYGLACAKTVQEAVDAMIILGFHHYQFEKNTGSP